MLSPRQSQIIALLRQCLTQEEIGRELGIKASTVNAHTDVIREKLRNKGYEFTTRRQFLNCVDHWLKSTETPSP